MDYLMQFADYASDNSIESFVESLDELAILFELYSPTVLRYFESAFITTNNAKQIQRVLWPKRAGQRMVVPKQTSHISAVRDIESAHQGRSHRQYKDVVVTMLRTDWIYNDNKKMDDLVVAMSQAKDDLFKTDLFHVLIGGFWTDYYWPIIYYGFIPWMCYTTVTLFYLSNYLRPPPSDSEDATLAWAPPAWLGDLCVYPILLLQLYLLASEGYQMSKLRLDYLANWSNLIQQSKAIFLFAILSSHSFGMDYLALQTCRRLAVVALALIYVEVFYWLKIIDKYAMVVRVLENTLKSVLIFITLLMVVVFGFANILYVLDQSRVGSGAEILDARAPLLIAIMGLTFDNTITAQHQADKEKIGILADWSWISKVVG